MSGCSSIKGALSAGARHDISQSSVTIDIYIYIETRGYIYIYSDNDKGCAARYGAVSNTANILYNIPNISLRYCYIYDGGVRIESPALVHARIGLE